jgi:hypothetical protein
MQNLNRLSQWALPAFLAVAALAADETWKTKQIAEWTDAEAKDVLTDSPWSKTTTPTIKAQQPAGGQQGMGRRGGGMGGGYPGGGGIGFPGGGIGFPGSRRGGYPGGYPGGGGGYPNGGQQSGQNYPNSGGRNDSQTPPQLTLRWETAMPVRAAEMKTHDLTPQSDDQHYTLAIYGVPERFVSGDHTHLEDQIKKATVLKRDGKKDVKASSIEIIDRPEGPVILCFFPTSAELSKQDRRVEFDSQLGRMQIVQSFYTEDMVWQGKLEI